MSDLWNTSSDAPSSTPSSAPSSSAPSSSAPASKQESGADLAYTGLATYGLFRYFIGAIVTTIIGIILIIAGYMQLHTVSTISENATITSINNSPTGFCMPVVVTQPNNNTSVNYTCTLALNFTHSGKTYNTSVSYRGPANHTIGQVIPVYFTDNPNNVSLTGNTPAAGWIMIVIGIGITGVSWALYWSARKWKPVAALGGGQSLMSDFSGSRGYNSYGGGSFMPGLSPGGMMPGFGGGGFGGGGLNIGGLFGGM